MWNGLTQDLRYALRTLLKSPLFLLVAVLSIGIGIGANAAIFSLMDQVLFRPLPVKDPDRLFLVDLAPGRIGATFTENATSHVAYRKLRASQTVFRDLMATYQDRANITYRGRSETATVLAVSGNYFSGLGLEASRGRLLGDADDQQRLGHPVVVLSHGYFQRRFGADEAIIGQTIRLNGRPYEVIGVAPAGFQGLEFERVASVYVPMAQKTAITTTWDGMDDPNYYFLHVFGALKPGLRVEQAKAHLDTLAPALIEEELKGFPAMPARGQQRFRQKRFSLIPVNTPLLGERQSLEKAFALLMGVVGFVLLIACANVANLMIARASAREKEVAVRLAMGAGSGRIVRQLLVESTMLALAGGALGLLASIWMLDGIIALNPVENAAELFVSSKPDWRVAGFCFAVSLGAALLFGLMPAARGVTKRIVESLKENTGALASNASQGLLRRALVVAQVTISVVLLVGAGLFARSLGNLRAQNPGFNPEYLLSFRVDPSLNGYERDRAVAFLENFSRDLAALPGVKNVSVASVPLLSNSVQEMTMSVEGIRSGEGRNMNSRANEVGPGYFAAMGYPILLGREFRETDRANSLKVAVVNEVFAKEYFNGNAIGKKIGFGRLRDGGLRLTMEIVGVVRDGKHANMREQSPSRFVYTPYTQSERIEGMTFYVRSQVDPERLVGDIRSSLRRVDENLSLFNVQTMERVIDRALVLERMLSILCSAFGLVATLLAALGLYGVMAYNVARRTREIGIRLALGADRGRVVSMVMQEAGRMLAIGLALGLPVAYGLGKLVESQLWGVQSGDLMVMSAAVGLMTLVAAAAGWLPAWRAGRVQPMRALRYE